MGYLAALFSLLVAIFLWVLIGLISIALSFTPTIIAFMRDHRYKMVILVLNFTVVGWFPALIWAVWPDCSERLSDNSGRRSQPYRSSDGYDDRNRNQSIDYDDGDSVAEQQWERGKKKASQRREGFEDES